MHTTVVQRIKANVDRDFGNLLIKFSDKEPVKSEEGLALVTVGVDEDGNVVYISVEPEDKELAEFVKKVKFDLKNTS